MLHVIHAMCFGGHHDVVPTPRCNEGAGMVGDIGGYH